jgi:hypothetical protein
MRMAIRQRRAEEAKELKEAEEFLLLRLVLVAWCECAF